jgi:alpha-glucosidase
MQTFSPARVLKVFLMAALIASTARAQTLARPGWAGSGMATEPWWQHAVIYRVVPGAFQDSDGDGKGDLRGVANRMDYLQSLGVDAVLLEEPAADVAGDTGFDDLISAAGRQHLRVLMLLEDGGNSATQPDSKLVALARLWLTRGASGIYLESKRSAAEVAPLLHQLRVVTDSFAGQRVLLAATATNPAPSTIHSILIDEAQPAVRVAKTKQTSGAQAGAQLVEVPLELTNATAKTIRAALNGVNNSSIAGTSGFFLSEQLFSAQALLDPANVASLDGRRRAFALVLLASRGAAALRYGQEIGMLPTVPSQAAPVPLMQWTPSNVAPVKKVEAAPVATKAPTEEYGTFHPYVPPPKMDTPRPRMPEVAPGGAPPPVDPDSLTGFTTAETLPASAVAPLDAKAINVAHEDPDPNSLLNLYRRLIQLHHDNPTLRSGVEVLLDYDDLGAVVWVRQPGRGSSTAIVAVCNLSGAPLHLSLNQELARQHVHTGSLRNLLSTVATQDSVQSTDNLTLPPYGVFLGELYH